jgi:formylglycine-generating enzyme required for sulfatase activity
VSWFDSLAFCQWFSAQLKSVIGERCARLPTEQEWQCAAVGETGWPYPGSAHLRESLGNYGNQIGHPTRVGSYPDGQSPYGVMAMLGNVWEWRFTAWGVDDEAVGGYGYRHIKGGAWNVSNAAYLRATASWGHPPCGRLNDCGFRCYRGQ